MILGLKDLKQASPTLSGTMEQLCATIRRYGNRKSYSPFYYGQSYQQQVTMGSTETLTICGQYGY